MTPNNKVSILIVEDEIILAHDLAIRLEVMGYQVGGIAESMNMAIQILEEGNIDMAIIDIIIKGHHNGIDLANIVNKDYHIPFIFLTSHSSSDYIAQAKNVKPSGYLLKPFNDRAIHAAIEMALVNYSGDHSDNSEDEKGEILQINDSLFLRGQDYFQRVRLDDILWLEAESNYTIFHTQANKFIYSTVLKRIEQKLPKDRFVRSHRSYVVNIHTITGFTGNLIFIGNKKIPVSKSHHEEIFGCFKTI